MIYIDNHFGDIPAGSIIALGNFDGVHIGHQEIIKTAISIGRNSNQKVGVLTFDPHPIKVIHNKSHSLLMPLEERITSLKSLGIDFVIIQSFTGEFSKLSAKDFIDSILCKQIKVSHCISGYNFRFGNKGVGDTSLLASYREKFGYTQINQIMFEGGEVSTTAIKSLLKAGKIERVNKLLLNTYSLSGKVIVGMRMAGPKLGAPTANLLTDDSWVLPYYGVYLVKISFENDAIYKYGIANIGVRPTWENQLKPQLEVHIFDFNDNLYGRNLKVEFLSFLRPERKFDGIEQLKLNILLDIKYAKYLLKANYNLLI